MERDPKSNNLAKPVDEVALSDVAKEVSAPISTTRPNYSINGTNNTKYKIEDLLGLTIGRNASDLHIAPGYPPVIRVDGELEDVGDRILNPEDAEELIFSVLSDEKKELLEVNREIDFAYTYESGGNARFRINAFYAMKNLCAAFRHIPSRIRTIEELMLPQMYHQFTKLKQGLILVTGPTGHGKSTTLASLLEDVNRTRFCHIVTIEDPVEYVFEGKKALVDQREMNDDTHSWDIALRSALRQDPDVLLVGEMRDLETISATITLAETGHLVFATLHTNSASQTIDRIIDVFPDNQQPQVRAQLSNILEAVVAQRLIPLEKGGRRAVSEIMLKNSAVGNLIREGKTNQIDNVIRTSSDIGMISLEKSLVNLVREGIISVQKAQEYAVFPEEVLRLLKN
ncbi:MAG: type IV pilus twitching motility protein PilT [Clostridiales bacterium]|nr:type IV pilus twitching motility protein PilT [Clostridiales bacterium]